MSMRDTRSVGSAYGRLYGPIAVAGVLISTQPLIEPNLPGATAAFVVLSSVEYKQSWTETLADLLFAWTAWPSDEVGTIGLVLLIGLAGGLVYATVRPVRRPRLPLGIALVATSLLVLLLIKPGAAGSEYGLSYIRTPPPDLTGAGRAALALSVLAAGLAAAHVLQLRRLSRSVDLR